MALTHIHPAATETDMGHQIQQKSLSHIFPILYNAYVIIYTCIGAPVQPDTVHGALSIGSIDSDPNAVL